MLSVSGAFISVVNEWMQRQGYGNSALCHRIRAIKPDATIDIAQAEVFLEETASVCGSELAALDIGRLVERRHLGAIGHMLASAKTLEEMVSGYVYYESLFYGKSIANVRRSEQGFELYWPIVDVPEHYSRFAMASFASAIEQMGLPRSVIEGVSFPFQDEKETGQYLDKIGCEQVFFGQELGLRFTASSLQKSLQSFDGSDEFQRRIAALFPELDDVNFALRLYSEIASALPKRQANISVISNQLAMSERTLQRKLERCEDGLRGVIRRIRMYLACEYLKDDSMNVLAVSLMLGYSEQSALQFAFKKYYGISPGRWRKEWSMNRPV